MPSYDYAFTGGASGVDGVGDRWVVTFGGTWAVGDTWTIAVTESITPINLTLGKGQIHNSSASVCFTYKERVFVGLLSQFNFSDNLDPTGWDEQSPGAGSIQYLSQFGGQDAIQAFAQLQGRLAVIARRSVQFWGVDADPSLFAIQQALDNIGTVSALAVQQLGDSDAIVLDDTGFRSLRATQLTLNATIDDIGSPVDEFVQAALVTLVDAQKALSCGVIEPKSKNYWCFVKDTIYVLSRHPSAKVSAWSTYEPRGNDNVLFTPQKFVTYLGRVYCRSTQRGHYLYGGTDNTTYDKYSQATFITPYLDDKRPGQMKTFEGLQAVMQGKWILSISADPQSNSYVSLYTGGNADSPNELTDSTSALGSSRVPLRGSHFSIKGVSQAPATTASLPAVFGQFLLFYNPSEMLT